VHGTSAITAITAQNTVEVRAIHAIPVQMVVAQIHAVLADIAVDAVKVGMLGTAGVTLAVAHVLDELPRGTPVVVDPVMVSESGARLLEHEAQRALVEEIVPRATVLTPNLPEARALLGSDPVRDGEDEEEGEALVRAVLALGPRVVVLTGGHRSRASDLFVEAAGDGRLVSLDGERHPDGAAHGSGCTHSSVLAAQLALGRSPLEAARIARSEAGAAVAHGLRDVGEGPGPVDVMDLSRMRAN
jgi:hydroxymethylpyrimidine/phosphomethylpyrimidine kinase